MMDKEKLRKADFFSGVIIFLIGLFIVSQSLQMPMKDTYGGVQNVWYVSPAIFPLFIGFIISLLGIVLFGIALKSIGKNGVSEAFRYLTGNELVRFLMQPGTIRFYAIITVFCSFIFIMIPRIDFFLSAILFLMVFISMFYFDDDELLKKILLFFISINAILILFFVLKVDKALSPAFSYPGDWLVMFFIASFVIYSRILVKKRPSKNDLKKKYRTCLILAIAAPLLVGVIFKFLLLVPMPFEGVVVELMDAAWYYEY